MELKLLIKIIAVIEKYSNADNDNNYRNYPYLVRP